MLYLLRSFGRNGATILNIGYAKDFKKELARYQDEYNPGAQEVDHRPGDKVDETILHLYLHDLGYNEYMDNYAYATYIDKKDFLPGLQGLYYSLIATKTKYDLIILYCDEITENDI